MNIRSLYSKLLQDYSNIYLYLRRDEEKRSRVRASDVARRIVPACVVIAAATLASVGTAPAARAQSSITFATASNFKSASTNDTLAAEAIFTIVNSTTLQIDIYNTGAATLQRPDILTTVLFNLDSSVTVNTATGKNGTSNVLTTFIPSGSLASGSGFTAASGLIDAGSGAPSTPPSPPNASLPVNGTYAFNNVSGTTALKASDGAQFKYGVSTVGYSGAFSAGAFNNTGPSDSSGGDDYGIVGYGTSGLNSGLNVFSDGVRVTVSNLSGLTSISQIKEVSFGYGSGTEPLAAGGSGYVLNPGFSPTPASPAALSVLIGVLVGAVTLGKQRRGKNTEAKTSPTDESKLF